MSEIKADGQFYYLNENYVKNVNNYLNLREDQLEAVLASLRAVLDDGELIAQSLEWKEWIFAPRDVFENINARKLAIPTRAPLMPLVVLFSGIGALRDYYNDNDIPETILRDTLFDIGRNLDIAKKRNGDYIIESSLFDWFAGHLTGRLFQLGRLQFEPAVLK
jgi:hypothetical protein